MTRSTHVRSRVSKLTVGSAVLLVVLAACAPPPPRRLPAPTPQPVVVPARPTPTAKPTATPDATGAVIVSFTVASPVVCDEPGGPVFPTISWVVTGATGVYIGIDGSGLFNPDPYPTTFSLNANGAHEIPFACSQPSHTYTLTTVGGTPNAEQTETISMAP